MRSSAEPSDEGRVYVGKGRFLADDPALYPGRDPGGLTGGWAGGEVGLKEKSVPGWASEAAASVGDAASPTQPSSERGKDSVYVGKGRWQRGDPALYPDKELGGLTGGWAGGEVGLKVRRDSFPSGSSVRVRGDPPAVWMRNGLFANAGWALGGTTGVVASTLLKGGSLFVTVRLTATAEAGSRVVVLKAEELELLA